MKAIALMGGFGTRLRPLTEDTPKQMLPIAGRPMIEWVAEHLARHGVSELVLALGYKADGIVDAYRSGTIAGLPFQVVIEPEALGTAGAIKYSYTELGLNERCLVVNGDVLSDLDITALVGFHESHAAAATISLQPVDEPERFGIVVTAADGLVQRFVEKPPPGTEESNLASAGTYVLEPSVMAGIASGRAVSIERETFPKLVQDQALYAMAQDTYWLDTGTPKQFLAANLDVLEGRRPLARVADAVGVGSADLSPADLAPADLAPADLSSTNLSPAGQVHAKALVRTSSIGERCRIEQDATVVRSVVMNDCVIEAGAVVSDSILAPQVRVGRAAIVAECSVIGRGQQIPAEAELRNVRQPQPPA